jgi:hypothetical protein
MKNETHTAGNSLLLQDYRKALLTAYELGEDIKKLYGIIPPKVITDTGWVRECSAIGKNGDQHITIGLTIN